MGSPSCWCYPSINNGKKFYNVDPNTSLFVRHAFLDKCHYTQCRYVQYRYAGSLGAFRNSSCTQPLRKRRVPLNPRPLWPPGSVVSRNRLTFLGAASWRRMRRSRPRVAASSFAERSSVTKIIKLFFFVADNERLFLTSLSSLVYHLWARPEPTLEESILMPPPKKKYQTRLKEL